MKKIFMSHKRFLFLKIFLNDLNPSKALMPLKRNKLLVVKEYGKTLEGTKIPMLNKKQGINIYLCSIDGGRGGNRVIGIPLYSF